MAVDGVPMQARSAVGILSPTAIVLPSGRVVGCREGPRCRPNLAQELTRRRGSRWKRVGQVVTVDVADWRV